MKWLAFVALFIASPVCAQSLRTPGQRPFHITLVPRSSVVLGSSAVGQLQNATVQGSGDTKVQLAAGATVTGHVPQYDANGGLVDSGGAPAASSFLNAMSATTAYALFGSL